MAQLFPSGKPVIRNTIELDALRLLRMAVYQIAGLQLMLRLSDPMIMSSNSQQPIYVGKTSIIMANI